MKKRRHSGYLVDYWMSEGGRVVFIGGPYREVKTLHASLTNSDGDS